MTQLEALRLADMLENNYPLEPEAEEAAAELRRLHEENEQLRQALAQPEQYDQTALELCDVCGWKTVVPDEGCLNCKRQALAQPEQEPVAWVDITDEGKWSVRFAVPALSLPDGTKFYTAPPSIEAAVLAEREACAKVADDWPNGRDDVCLIAAAIRARNKK